MLRAAVFTHLSAEPCLPDATGRSIHRGGGGPMRSPPMAGLKVISTSPSSDSPGKTIKHDGASANHSTDNPRADKGGAFCMYMIG